MNACTLRLLHDAAGRPYLSGTMNYALDAGATVILRKLSETEYALNAVSGDGRPVTNSRETLGSFAQFDRDIPELPQTPKPEPDPIADEFRQMAEEGRA